MDYVVAVLQILINIVAIPLFVGALIADVIGFPWGKKRKLMPKSILITGATSGIGEALALRYASRPGTTLVLTGRNLSNLEKVASECRAKGAAVYTKQVDVIEEQALGDWIKEMDATVEGGLDLVVANAGISEQTAGIDLRDIEQCARKLYAANVFGLFNTIFPALPAMRARGRGQIALMSSMSSFIPMAGAPAYSSSKWAVRLFGMGMRAQMYREGISVNVIAPGFVRSPMTDINKFPMEYLVEMDYAIDQIVNGLENDKALIAFPWQMLVLAYFLLILPPTLFDFFARNRYLSWIAYWKPSKRKVDGGEKKSK